MTRYWVIAPYNASDKKAWEGAWKYDFSNQVIAVGWKDLGDISRYNNKEELRRKIEELYPNIRLAEQTKSVNQIWNFWHNITTDDIIIARRGTKRIAAIGQVIRTAFYDTKMGYERLGNHTDNFYSNFIGVNWQNSPRNIQFERPVFPLQTILEYTREKYESLIQGTSPPEDDEDVEDPGEFALEKHLEDFIVKNFKKIFKNELEIYIDSEGEKGQQYITASEDGKIIGRIDILAKEPKTNSYVVIELKKGRSSNTVVGQILSYIGWVEENLCQANEKVKGIIICKDQDERLSYAIKMIKDRVNIKKYIIDFQLFDVP